jgi:hypothetical protein
MASDAIPSEGWPAAREIHDAAFRPQAWGMAAEAAERPRAVNKSQVAQVASWRQSRNILN